MKWGFKSSNANHSDFALILVKIYAINPINMASMFYNATHFNQNLGSWDMRKVTNVYFMLRNADLSIENYDATLQGWAQQNLQNNRTLHATGIKYSNFGKGARDKITSKYNWTIIGDSLQNVPTNFDFDIDNDGNISAATDGILIIRYLLNPEAGVIDTTGLVGINQTDTVAILAALNKVKNYFHTDGKALLDIDADGITSPSTDGILILRYLLAPDAPLNITDAVGDNASRNTAEAIKAYLQTL